MQVKATELRKGMVLQKDGDLLVITDYSHSTPGNWRAIIQVKTRSLTTGQNGSFRPAAGDTFETAFLERKKAQIVDVRKLGAPELAALTRLYQVESQLSDLVMQRDLASRVYLEVATAYETARLQVAGRSAQLQIIEPAVPPDLPLSRHVARNTLLAAVVGLMLSVFGVLLYGGLSTEPQSR